MHVQHTRNTTVIEIVHVVINLINEVYNQVEKINLGPRYRIRIGATSHFTASR